MPYFFSHISFRPHNIHFLLCFSFNSTNTSLDLVLDGLRIPLPNKIIKILPKLQNIYYQNLFTA